VPDHSSLWWFARHHLSSEQIEAALREAVRRLGKPGDLCRSGRLLPELEGRDGDAGGVKRRCGKALTARLEPTQQAQALPRGVAYNVHRLVIPGCSS
jgi:hypothetical protein